MDLIKYMAWQVFSILIILGFCLIIWTGVSYAGGGDFMMKQQAVQRAYKEIKPVHKVEMVTKEEVVQPSVTVSKETPSPDVVDNIYVWIRSMLPDWLILVCFILGGVQILLAIPITKTILGNLFGGLRIVRKGK